MPLGNLPTKASLGTHDCHNSSIYNLGKNVFFLSPTNDKVSWAVSAYEAGKLPKSRSPAAPAEVVQSGGTDRLPSSTIRSDLKHDCYRQKQAVDFWKSILKNILVAVKTLGFSGGKVVGYHFASFREWQLPKPYSKATSFINVWAWQCSLPRSRVW